MSEPIYTARSVTEVVGGTHRRVKMQAGGSFDTGVHGPIKAHYRIEDRKDLPLPVDYIAAATGA